MKRILNYNGTLFLLGLFVFISSCQQEKSLYDKISGLEGIQVQETYFDTTQFKEAYEISIKQDLDHKNPGKGYFEQRVFIYHKGFNKPVVFVTEGYNAEYAKNGRYTSELVPWLDANQIVVEHRFFGESVPDTLQWEYLNTWQAATDHHQLVELFKQYYKGQWLNTGISKGGQTAVYHRFYYPEDVDATVGYVCPINFSSEEPRVYSFLKQVGSDSCRNKILNFQKCILKRRDEMMPLFIQKAEEMNYTHKIGHDKAFEYNVLEYSFAFWQWGTVGCEEIPSCDTTSDALFKHMLKVNSLDFFSDQGMQTGLPFFYQALTEIGFYSYDTHEFEGLLQYIEKPDFKEFIPSSIELNQYNYESMANVNEWLETKATNILFLYGENDPWSASSANAENNPNLLKIVKPGGSHLTRIRNLDPVQKEKALQSLEKWLNIEIAN